MEDKDLDQLFINLQSEEGVYSGADAQWKQVSKRLSPKRNRLFFWYIPVGLVLLFAIGYFAWTGLETNPAELILSTEQQREIEENRGSEQGVLDHSRSETSDGRLDQIVKAGEVLETSESMENSLDVAELIVKQEVEFSTKTRSENEKESYQPSVIVKQETPDKKSLTTGNYSSDYSEIKITESQKNNFPVYKDSNNKVMQKESLSNSVVVTDYLPISEIQSLTLDNAIQHRIGRLSILRFPSKIREQNRFTVGLGLYKQLFDYEGVEAKEIWTPSLFFQYTIHGRWSVFTELSRYKVNRLVFENPSDYNFPEYGDYGLITFQDALVNTTEWNIETGVEFAFYKAKNLQVAGYSAAIFKTRNGLYRYTQFVDYAMDVIDTAYNGRKVEIDDMIIGLNTSYHWKRIGIEILYGYYVSINSSTLNWNNRHKVGMRIQYAF